MHEHEIITIFEVSATLLVVFIIICKAEKYAISSRLNQKERIQKEQ